MGFFVALLVAALLGLVTSRDRVITSGNRREDLLMLCEVSREVAINHPNSESWACLTENIKAVRQREKQGTHQLFANPKTSS